MSSHQEVEDQYGQIHPNETAALVVEKLKELETELAKISQKQRDGYDQAVQRCPNLLTAEFKLMFLRCEVFNTDLAALRLCKYWKKRIEIFGEEKAFLPLTQKGALQDDAVALALGVAKLVPAKDPTGRAIVLFDPALQDKTKYVRESMTRSIWYVVHAGLEDVDSQKKGIVILVAPQNAKFSQFDRTLSKMNVESIKGCIPLRLSGVHICHPPSFFQVIWPIMRIFMGERLRKRVRVHGGTEDHVLERLEEFGLTKDRVPSMLLGGAVEMDHAAWLAARKDANK